MNAPNPITAAISATMENPVGAFLSRMSIEITPKQIDKLPIFAAKLASGSAVFIALIDPSDVANQLQAAIALRAAGFDPIPHIPARFVIDEADLAARISDFAKLAGVTSVLVLGGGAPTPTGVFEANGITTIGIAGHPEGNPDITKIHGEAVLLSALLEKQAWIKSKGLQGFIATQFLFDAGPLAFWARQLREAGIDLPIRVGVPGPASIKTLVKYAAMCGVGNSARFIRKQALNITKLLTVSAPDEFCDQLATLHFDKPELNIHSPHMYPFGGFDKLFDWLGSKGK
jgi:methylenetetrahydrofolate reductase (NADPH)